MRKLPAAFLLLPIMVLLLNGCTESLEDGLPGSESNPSYYHSTGWKDDPQHGSDYDTNPQNCEACHGEDLEGGSSGISCAACHHGGWTGTHGEEYAANPDNCKTCHGEDLTSVLSGTSCVACHADNLHHGAAVNPYCSDCHHENDISDCGGCHPDCKPGSHPTHTTLNNKGPAPALACYGCHDTNHYPLFGKTGDAESLAATTVCDNCHSPGGAFDGVVMAKANWDDGVYEEDGTTIQSGKEQWCASCHDDAPALSTSQLYEVVVDNPDATFVGTWTTGSNTDQYGDSVDWHPTGVGDNTATWTPDIPYAGQYSVYAWWTVHPNRAKDATYTIYYNGGPATVEVNQEINGGKWNYLGTYPFAEGTDGYVVLSDDSAETGQYVIADAVKFAIGPEGIYAPKVIGDNSTYGYYATGHGAHDLVQCLDCHDASATHIDNDARTYDAGVSDYCNSYRLKEIDGQPAMDVQRSSGNPLTNWKDFALCFECHDRYAVIGTSPADVSQTNFWDADASPNNSHWYHLQMGNIYDSDYDGTTDSAPSCPACHNVHGSPTGPMIRHGELISPYGTASYVPSFNFYYLIAGDGSATATFAPSPTLAGGIYNVYAWWSVHTNRATNAKYLINHDGGQAEVIVNQEQNGGQWNLLGQYNFAAGTGSVVLTSEGANEYIMADAVRWYRTDGGDEVIVDDPDATYTGTWTESTDARYGTSYRQHNSGSESDTATWIPDIPTAGTYSVYAWWHENTDRATDAPFTINYDGGSPTVTKDQQQDGGAWNLLGTYLFAAGTSGYVQLGESDTGRVIADAIGWDSDGVLESDWNSDGVLDPELVVDDPDAVYVGTWTLLTTDRYKHSTRYHYAPTLDANAAAIDSVGATMQSGGINSNHSCGT